MSDFWLISLISDGFDLVFAGFNWIINKVCRKKEEKKDDNNIS